MRSRVTVVENPRVAAILPPRQFRSTLGEVRKYPHVGKKFTKLAPRSCPNVMNENRVTFGSLIAMSSPFIALPHEQSTGAYEERA